MQLPFEEQNLTVEEAADVLNVRRERIWKLMNDGVLTAEPSKLDGRRRIPNESQPDSEYSMGATSRPWPRSIGMVSDGTLPSSEIEVYLRKRLHGEPI